MTGPDSDTVCSVKKNIGYAKFFLKVGKRSDAQDRLRKSLVIIQEASRWMRTVTNETHKLMVLTEEIHALWKESEETPDPPGSSFVLAMGDMIYLATPGGGMTVVNLDPENESESSDKGVRKAPSPQTPPETPEVPVNLGGKEKPTGFFSRFNPFGRDGNNNDEEEKEEEADRLREEEARRQKEEDDKLAEQSKNISREFRERTEREAREKEEALKNANGSVNLDDRNISYIFEAPSKDINNSDNMNDHVEYTVAHIGKEKADRPKVFLEAMYGKDKSTIDISRRTRSSIDANGAIVAKIYAKTYFSPVCDAINGTGVGNYEEEFVRYVNGEADNSYVFPKTGVENVTRFTLMVLQTVPPRVSKRRGGIEEIDPTGLKKISSFAFLDIDRVNPDQMYISLICANKNKPIVSMSPEETVKNGKLMMDKITSLARAYGKSLITLGSVNAAIGIYFARGFKTMSEKFNKVFNEYNTIAKFVRERAVGYDPMPESKEDKKVIDSVFKEYRFPLEDLIRGYAPDPEESKIQPISYINDNIYRGSSSEIAKTIAVDILEIMRRNRHLGNVISSVGRIQKLSGAKAILEHMLEELSDGLLNIYTIDKHGNTEISMSKYI